MNEKEALTKDILVDKINKQLGHPVKDAKFLLESIIELIKENLEKGDEVKISSFGSWKVRQKRERPGRNPHTKEQMKITARRVVTFHPADKFRELINLSEQK